MTGVSSLFDEGTSLLSLNKPGHSSVACQHTELCQTASKLLRSNAALGLDAMVVDFERASGPWHLEWAAIPSAFVLAAGSLHQTEFALSGLVVNTGTMLENLNSTKGLIVGEAVMMALAPFIGRQEAHDLVYEACKESIETGNVLHDVLRSKSVVLAHFDEARLSEVCDPIQYFGANKLMVDNMLHVADTSVGGVNGVIVNTVNGHTDL